MFVGGVVDGEIHDDPDAPLMGGGQKGAEILHRPVLGIDAVIVRDVVFVVAGGGHDRHEPDAVAAQIPDIVQLFREAVEIAHAVAVAVGEGPDEHLVPLPVFVVDPRRRVPDRRVPCCRFGR